MQMPQAALEAIVIWHKNSREDSVSSVEGTCFTIRPSKKKQKTLEKVEIAARFFPNQMTLCQMTLAAEAHNIHSAERCEPRGEL